MFLQFQEPLPFDRAPVQLFRQFGAHQRWMPGDQRLKNVEGFPGPCDRGQSQCESELAVDLTRRIGGGPFTAVAGGLSGEMLQGLLIIPENEPTPAAEPANPLAPG